MTKLYAMFEHKISERVIERAWLNGGGTANADGTIDSYQEKIGQWDGFASYRVETYEEAEALFKNNYPTIWAEDEVQIIIRQLPCECCKRTGYSLQWRKGYGEICSDCHTVLDIEEMEVAK